MTKIQLPEEDSLDAKPKPLVWNKKNIKKIDTEVNKLAKLVKNNLNISQIVRLIN